MLDSKDLVIILSPGELSDWGVEVIHMTSQVYSLMRMIMDLWGLLGDLQCGDN